MRQDILHFRARVLATLARLALTPGESLYIDDPSNHLRFYGPVVFQAPGDVKGYRTRTILDLARMSLCERRKEKIERLQTLIDTWSSRPEGPTRELMKTQLLSELRRDKEYSAAARAFVFQSTGLEP